MRAPIWIPTLAVAAAVTLAALLWPGAEPDQAGIEEGLEPAATTHSQRTPLTAEGPTAEGADQRTPIETELAEHSATGTSESPSTEITGPEVDPDAQRRAENLRLRREQMEKAAKARAIRIADDLALGTGAELKLMQVFLEEHDELTAIRAEFVAGDRSKQARTLMREQMAAVPAKREQRLAVLFGPDTARAIVGYEDAGGQKSFEFGQEKPEEEADQD